LVQYSFASTITHGVFDISGTVFFTAPKAGAVVTPAGTCPAGTACIFWENSAGTLVDKVDISTVGLPSGDIPLAISGNAAANISNLTNPPEVVGGAGFAPTTFMTFNNGGVTTQLLLDFIDPGVFPSTDCALAPAVGQICSPPGSAVNFVNNPPRPGQASASWVLEGVTDTPGISWTGNFGSQFTTPYQTVLANLASKGSVEETFSATISLTGTTTTVPEPGSMGLTMIGMALIATFVGRRSAK